MLTAILLDLIIESFKKLALLPFYSSAPSALNSLITLRFYVSSLQLYYGKYIHLPDPYFPLLDLGRIIPTLSFQHLPSMGMVSTTEENNTYDHHFMISNLKWALTDYPAVLFFISFLSI